MLMDRDCVDDTTTGGRVYICVRLCLGSGNPYLLAGVCFCCSESAQGVARWLPIDVVTYMRGVC